MADFQVRSPSPANEAIATGSHRSPAMSNTLRNRQLGRASTFPEPGTQSPTTFFPPRRRSSLLSNLSVDDARQSLRSSTDSLRRPGDDGTMDKFTSEEPEGSQWHSLPLSFVLLPAVAGLIWSNGNTVASDLMLISLACIFLYWCTRLPWDWYKAAQVVPIFELPDVDCGPKDIIIEEEDEAGPEDPITPPPETVDEDRERITKSPSLEQESAFYGLRKTETMALFGCFLGPLLGAYFLHTLRTLLSPPSESLLNDFNLSVFVMVAEARPFALVCRLERSRISHLQRVAYPDGRSAMTWPVEELRDVTQRLETMEHRLADILGNKEEKDVNSEISASVRQGLQPQLDALNRAVRRYEKRSVVQTMQTEARLNNLESRLQDALSLAAAAARNGQKPGFFARLLDWISGIFLFCFYSTWAVITYPFQVAGHFLYLTKCWVSGRPARQSSKKKAKSKSFR